MSSLKRIPSPTRELLSTFRSANARNVSKDSAIDTANESSDEESPSLGTLIAKAPRGYRESTTSSGSQGEDITVFRAACHTYSNVDDPIMFKQPSLETSKSNVLPCLSTATKPDRRGGSEGKKHCFLLCRSC